MEDKIILTKSEFREIFNTSFSLGIDEGKHPTAHLKPWEISRYAFEKYVETLPKGIRFILEED